LSAVIKWCCSCSVGFVNCSSGCWVGSECVVWVYYCILNTSLTGKLPSSIPFVPEKFYISASLPTPPSPSSGPPPPLGTSPPNQPTSNSPPTALLLTPLFPAPVGVLSGSSNLPDKLSTFPLENRSSPLKLESLLSSPSPQMTSFAPYANLILIPSGTFFLLACLQGWFVGTLFDN
jgi:hypothetical protein